MQQILRCNSGQIIQKVIDRLQVYSDLSPTAVGRYNDLFLEFKMQH